MGVYYGMNGLWVPIGGQGVSADSNLLAENIKSGVTIRGITGTFTNDGTAKSSDMADGVTAYVNGQKVTGNVTTMNGNTICTYSTNTSVGEETDKIAITTPTLSNNILFRTGARIQVRSPKSEFGDATAADVASGKTFTSSAGLKITGTASAGLGDIVTVVSLDIKTSNWADQQLSSDRKVLVWALPDVKFNNYSLSDYLNGKVSGISHISFGNLREVSNDGSSIAVCSIGFDREGNDVGFISTLNNRLNRTGTKCSAVLNKTNNKIIITAVSSGSLLWDANAYYDIFTLGLYVDP